MTTNSEIHGGDVFAAARELDCSWKDILDYSANLNPLGPPPGLKKHLFQNFTLAENYPDPEALAWRSELAADHGLTPAEIVAGNGSTALMYLLARVLRPRRPVLAAPAFAEYEKALAQAGVRPEYEFCRPEDDFDLTQEVVERIFARRPDLVFLTNPTSPAGRMIEPEVLDLALRLAERNGSTLALDEAFLDFTDAASMAASVREHPCLVVLRSLTKIYALPGLRLGYLTAGKELAGRLLESFEPWSVNSLALAAGSFCRGLNGYEDRTRKMIAGERRWLTRKIEESGLGRVIPGEANYLLVRLDAPGWTVETLSLALRKRGILIRNCASFQGILKGYLRLAVKGRAQNTRLVNALREVLSRPL